MAEPLHPGDPRQLGSFYLDGRLGAGGQGVVYEGYGPGGERVAVKALYGVHDRDREMLRKETWAWRKVAAYCTAKVLHADLDGPIPFVVSEHVAGPNLRQAVERAGRYGPDELRRLAIGLATALVGVHRARVVHRDLKPENILLAPDGPRLIDFGIARIEEQPTTTGLLKGTLRYMPPERYRGEHGDAKVDVWGWGAVVLFAATGRHAFTGDTPPVIARQVETHHPDTSVLEEPLRSLVAASLAKDPADRPGAEDLLLGLVGAIDLKEATRRAVPDDRPEPPEPSRAELAEVVFTGLGVREQEAVPHLLLRLVAPGERAEDTLRSARRDEFSDGQVDDRVVDRVLRDFTGAGVLVWTDGTVTLSSAALIRAWPRLREWADAERAGLGVHQDLVDASRLWHGHGRKRSDLYQGTALETRPVVGRDRPPPPDPEPGRTRLPGRGRRAVAAPGTGARADQHRPVGPARHRDRRGRRRDRPAADRRRAARPRRVRAGRGAGAVAAPQRSGPGAQARRRGRVARRHPRVVVGAGRGPAPGGAAVRPAPRLRRDLVRPGRLRTAARGRRREPGRAVGGRQRTQGRLLPRRRQGRRRRCVRRRQDRRRPGSGRDGRHPVRARPSRPQRDPLPGPGSGERGRTPAQPGGQLPGGVRDGRQPRRDHRLGHAHRPAGVPRPAHLRFRVVLPAGDAAVDQVPQDGHLDRSADREEAPLTRLPHRRRGQLPGGPFQPGRSDRGAAGQERRAPGVDRHQHLP